MSKGSNWSLLSFSGKNLLHNGIFRQLDLI
jgi:hypothetical protein